MSVALVRSMGRGQVRRFVTAAALAMATVCVGSVASAQEKAGEKAAPAAASEIKPGVVDRERLQKFSVDAAQQLVTDLGGTWDATKYKNLPPAISDFLQQRVKMARDKISAVVKENPELPPAGLIMAALWAATQQGQNYRAELELAASEHPDEPQTYLMLADAAFAERRLAEAETLFLRGEELTKKFNGDPKRKAALELRVIAGLAAVAETRQQWEKADKLLAEWIAREPNNPGAHQRHGRVLFKLGREDGPKKSFAAYQTANKLDSKSILPEIALARLYADARDYKQAETLLRHGLKKDPKNLQNVLQAVQLTISANLLKQAEEFADEALKIDPQSVDAKYLRGVVAQINRDYSTAEKHLESAYMLSPSNFQTANQLALVLVEQKDKAKQQRALEYAGINFQRNQQSPDAVATLGWVQYRLGNKQEAAKALQAVVNSGALTPDSAYYVAAVMKDDGKVEEARQLLTQALASEQLFVHRHDAQELLNSLPKAPPAPALPGEGKS